MPKDWGVRSIARDVVYGPKARHRLDIFAPTHTEKPLPVIVFFYGGGWESGDRSEYQTVGRALAALGAIVVVADYRVYPDAIYPAFLHDCALAVQWVSRHIQDYQGDPSKLVIAGHSAGAYNAVMVATDPALHHGHTFQNSICGVIGLSGPYDFFPYDVEVSIRSFGGAGAGEESQPINLDLSRAPAMFLGHGTADKTVRLRNTEALAAALRAAGRPVTEAHYPGASHALTLLALMPLLRWRLPLYRDLDKFLTGLFD